MIIFIHSYKSICKCTFVDTYKEKLKKQSFKETKTKIEKSDKWKQQNPKLSVPDYCVLLEGNMNNVKVNQSWQMDFFPSCLLWNMTLFICYKQENYS